VQPLLQWKSNKYYIFWSSRLGVGREANNLTPEKTTLFRNLIEIKNGLIFWSDTGEGKD
jgi:hypothetical protein